MRTCASAFLLSLFVCTLSALAPALENSIYVRFDSETGDFPDAAYYLGQYKVTLEKNNLKIDGKQIFNATGKQIVELFVDNDSIRLRIDNALEIVPNL